MRVVPPELFELLNCLLWTTGFFLELIFIWYFATELRDTKIQMRSIWSTFSTLRMRDQAAIGITVMTLGEVIARYWTWMARYQANTGGNPQWSSVLPWVLIPVFGALVETVGRCCMIRVFTPDDWGNRGWLLCVGISVTVTAFFSIYR